MGCGFTLALTTIGLIREFLSAGTLFNVLVSENYPVLFSVMGQAPGGFMVMGFILAGMNFLNMRKARKEGRDFVNPVDMDCKHCMICNISDDR